MKVLGSRYSRAFRVLWMLEEMGMEFEHVPSRPHDPELVKVNPQGKIPVIIDGDLVISDSTAILHYLADRYNSRFTSTPGTAERARQDSLTGMILDEFDSCMWAAARHSFVLPEEYRVGDLKRTLKWEFRRSEAAIVSRATLDPYLMGDRLTIPDIIFSHCLHWAKVAKFPLTEPLLIAYLQQIEHRPAYVRAQKAG